MGYKKKWYDSEKLMKLLYIDRGLSIDEIAEYIKVSDETVRKLLIKHRLKGNR